MKFGITMFATDYAIQPAELALEADPINQLLRRRGRRSGTIARTRSPATSASPARIPIGISSHSGMAAALREGFEPAGP